MEGFIEAVERATDFVAKRNRDKSSRKGKRKEGIDYLYEDERCFFVSPKSAKYSHEAAYLDGGTANWCIASRDNAEEYWKQYCAKLVVYAFYKGEPADSWAIVFTDENCVKILLNAVGDEPEISQFETRRNNIGGNVRERLKAFDEFLTKVRMSDDMFYDIIREHLERVGIEL